MRDATLVFLIKKSEQGISEVCLAMKKRGFGVNRWNGVGGKVNEGEEIIEAAKREAKEEIGVEIEQINKMAELDFFFPHNETWNQKVHVYFCENWQNEPAESEEMKPQWFLTAELPFNEMWPDDEFWVPQVLAGNLLKAMFTFGEGDVIQNQNIEIVEEL
ncbi:MAG: 8-oxo-dGTP diphosphatase [Candidatus Pacebacteria bacterium]|nr:8-oxo-dGTP diphosphatase [Candidatus Paceibacterota bacterium]